MFYLAILAISGLHCTLKLDHTQYMFHTITLSKTVMSRSISMLSHQSSSYAKYFNICLLPKTPRFLVDIPISHQHKKPGISSPSSG